MVERYATDRPAGGTGGTVTGSCVADPSQALVVAGSPVNRIVLTRIAQRAYLKVNAMDPAAARRALSAGSPMPPPGLVIVDVDAQMQLSDTLFDHLGEHRSASPRQLPLVITIVPSRDNPSPDPGTIDAQVVRPVTLETLQPLIQRLLSGVQG